MSDASKMERLADEARSELEMAFEAFQKDEGIVALGVVIAAASKLRVLLGLVRELRDRRE